MVWLRGYSAMFRASSEGFPPWLSLYPAWTQGVRTFPLQYTKKQEKHKVPYSQEADCI